MWPPKPLSCPGLLFCLNFLFFKFIGRSIKELLLKQKLGLEEKLKETESMGNNWLEPMRDFILLNKQTKKIAKQGNFSEIRESLKTIGSNFILKDKSLLFTTRRGLRCRGAKRRSY